jgi:hypothetical protein
MTTFKEVAKKTFCADGVSLSIQASRTHYSVPREDTGPYTMVEVGFIEDKKGKQFTPPRTWKKYTDGSDFPNDVYGYIPVKLVERFIKQHGGVKKGPGIPS